MGQNWRSSEGLWSPTPSCFATLPGKEISPRSLVRHQNLELSGRFWGVREANLQNGVQKRLSRNILLFGHEVQNCIQSTDAKRFMGGNGEALVSPAAGFQEKV